jgi:hypothetical protein
MIESINEYVGSISDRLYEAVFKLLAVQFEEAGYELNTRRSPSFEFIDGLTWSLISNFIMGVAAGLVSGRILERAAARRSKEKTNSKATVERIIVACLPKLRKGGTELKVRIERDGAHREGVELIMLEHGWAKQNVQEVSEKIVIELTQSIVEAASLAKKGTKKRK